MVIEAKSDEPAPRHPLRPDFPVDAFKGTAEYYERYRPPYPDVLLADLRSRTGVTGEGRLLDIACGTGQIARPMAPFFREVWALDQEPEMLRVGQEKAGPDSSISWRQGRAEDLAAPAGHFELVTIGNAFHRLHRRDLCAKIRNWLQPGGYLAVLGNSCGISGSADWQALAKSILRKWQGAPAPAAPREAGQERETFVEALAASGFEAVREFHHEMPHEWSLDTFIGYLFSTSLAAPGALGEKMQGLEQEMRDALLAHNSTGRYVETIRFYMILAREPQL